MKFTQEVLPDGTVNIIGSLGHLKAYGYVSSWHLAGPKENQLRDMLLGVVQDHPRRSTQ